VTILGFYIVQLPTDVVVMATSDVLQFIKVCGDPGVGVVRIVGTDAQSFLVADRVSVVEPDALRPVQCEATVDVGGRPVALCDCAVDGVLQTSTSVREPVRYLHRSKQINMGH